MKTRLIGALVALALVSVPLARAQEADGAEGDGPKRIDMRQAPPGQVLDQQVGPGIVPDFAVFLFSFLIFFKPVIGIGQKQVRPLFLFSLIKFPKFAFKISQDFIR